MVVAVAAALVAFIVFPGRADETIREVPADQPTSEPIAPVETAPPATTPTVTTPSVTTPTVTTPTVTTPTAGTGDPFDLGPARLVDDADFDGWDGAGGQCAVLRLDAPLDTGEVRMCVTGRQIEHGVTAYVRSQGVEWSLWLSSTDAVEGRSTQSGTGWIRFDHASCGPPAHEVPDDRWVMVSHCTDDAALYTVLPDSPNGATSHMIGTSYGLTVDATLVQSLDVDGPHEVGIDRLEVLEVPSALSGVLLRCVVVAPVSADRWFESCHVDGESPWNTTFLHAGHPYVLHGVSASPPLLTALPTEATLRSNGCVSPVGELLAAMSDPAACSGVRRR